MKLIELLQQYFNEKGHNFGESHLGGRRVSRRVISCFKHNTAHQDVDIRINRHGLIHLDWWAVDHQYDEMTPDGCSGPFDPHDPDFLRQMEMRLDD